MILYIGCVKKRFMYRLRPGAQAEKALRAEWNNVRFLWNMCVIEYKQGNKPTLCSLSRKLTTLRAEHVWLAEGSSVPQQQCVRNYAQALHHSFKVKGRGRPVFKKRKHSLPTLEYTRSGFTIKDDKLSLAKIPDISVVWSRPLPSTPTTATVYQDAVGSWWVSFVVEIEETEPLPAVNKAIGVDPGIKRPATTTDPVFNMEYQAHGKSKQAKLARYQRMMARRYEKGADQSKGYQQAKKTTAKLHRSVKNQRKEYWRAWAQHICRAYDQIALEDFKPKFVNRNKKMSRKSHDIALGLMKKELQEWSRAYGRTLVLVQPAYTTQACSRCSAITKLTLQDRVYNCQHCGMSLDRDMNAALNICKWAGFTPPSVKNIRLLRSSELAAV